MPALADLMRNAVRAYGTRPAVVDAGDGVTQTYRDFDGACNRVAHALRSLGLPPGAHVAILQRNSRHWVSYEGGLAKGGFVTVPLNVLLSAQEVLWLLNHSETRALIFSAQEAAMVDAIRERATTCRHFLCTPWDGARTPAWAIDLGRLLEDVPADDPSVEIAPAQPHRIMYTSATTGLPKGVIVPNQVFADSLLAALANQLHGLLPSDRFLVVTPLTHMAIGSFWPFFMRGSVNVIARHFTPEAFCRLVVAHRITHTILVPTMIIMLLRHLAEDPDALARLRGAALKALWYAGSPIPVPVAREAERLLGPILNQQYGFTEMLSSHPSMAVTQLPAEWHASKPDSCGRPLVGSVVRVVDEAGKEVPVGELGEVVVKAHQAIGGYWKLPDGVVGAFRDGWIHSGDVGHFDEDGFLYIKDRKNDMIISGGLNVYPVEVENVLAEHPAVHQCAVVGIADQTWVEVPCAVVVRRTGSNADEGALIDFVRARLAHYKAPKRVVFVDALPTSAIGKVLKRQIREELKALPPES